MSKRKLVTDEERGSLTEEVKEETKVVEPEKPEAPRLPQDLITVTEGSAFPLALKSKESIAEAIEMVKNGTVSFVGAYHENRKAACLKALEARL